MQNASAKVLKNTLAGGMRHLPFPLFNINCVPRIPFLCIFAAKSAYIGHGMTKTTNLLHRLAATCKRFFKRLADATGLPCVYAGVLLMVVLYIFRLTNYDALLLLPVLLILAGIAGYVRKLKAESNY